MYGRYPIEILLTTFSVHLLFSKVHNSWGEKPFLVNPAPILEIPQFAAEFVIIVGFFAIDRVASCSVRNLNAWERCLACKQ